MSELGRPVRLTFPRCEPYSYSILADGQQVGKIVEAREIHGHMTIEDSGPTLGFRMIGYQNHHGHAKDLREVITAALAGEQLSEDGDHG